MCRNIKSGLLQVIYVMLLVLSCTIAQASEWWSLGAFKIAANAERESNRINAETGSDTIISRSGDLYRIVLKKDHKPAQQKAYLNGLGLHPWTLDASQVKNDNQPDEMETLDIHQPAVALEPVQHSNSMQDEPALQTVYEISAPKAGEKLRDYCIRRANKQERAVYCSNDVFNRVASAQVRVKNQSEADNLLYCALLAGGAERQARCGRN